MFHFPSQKDLYMYESVLSDKQTIEQVEKTIDMIDQDLTVLKIAIKVWKKLHKRAINKKIGLDKIKTV